MRSGNNNSFRESLIRKLGLENLSKIESVRVGIAGAGGLGSNLAMSLVRTGFTKLKIVDFDVVEAQNLDRQFYFADQVGMYKIDALAQNLLQINDHLDLSVEERKIERTEFEQIFNCCEIVAECLDLPEYKCALVSELMHTDKLIVAASGLGGFGSSDEIRVHRIHHKVFIVGDLQSDVSKKPALSPRISLAAAKQADVIIDYVLRHHGLTGHDLSGQIGVPSKQRVP